jgi:drug/metabolite transporter (DMT)-like permease
MAEPQPPLVVPRSARPTRAIFWMIVTGILFVAVTATVKHGAQGLPAAESAFLRYVLGIVFLIPMLKPLRAAKLTSRQKKLFWIRGLAHSLAIILWFHAMTRITIAEVTAMNYMNPIYITIGAALFLGERLASRRIIAIAAGFLGALIILRPGFRELTDGHLAMVGAAMLFAVSYLTAKLMADEVSASAVVAMLSITVTVCLFPIAIAVWQTPTLEQLFWMFVVATFATAGHYTMTLAFAEAPVSVTQPVVFLQLVWSVLTGAVFFGEPADGWVILGGAVIVAATTFIAVREAMLRRSHKGTPA